MANWQVALDLKDPKGAAEQPIFIRLARAISDDVRRGRLKPGDALPGSRSLARALGVHRNTVLAAYAELAAEGWITTEAAARTFVSHALPDVEAQPRRRATTTALGFDLDARIASREPREARRDFVPAPDVLAMSGGIPDVRLVPTAPLARAYRRALKRGGPSLLGYGDARGHARLRSALGDMLSALRGVAADSESLMVTRGSQLALDLVARTLLAPGDVVAVEALGYRPAWTALAAAGARLVPIAVDEHGIDVDALEALAARERLRAVYVTPHHQYPTTVMLDAGRRLRLLELARARRIAIIEDDYDFEFHYEGRPVLPLAAADQHAVVVYIGTLSKILAPSLRLGFVVAPPALI
jgi:GntR family transcriptional regulator/MocR family aminotransferase